MLLGLAAALPAHHCFVPPRGIVGVPSKLRRRDEIPGPTGHHSGGATGLGRRGGLLSPPLPTGPTRTAGGWIAGSSSSSSKALSSKEAAATPSKGGSDDEERGEPLLTWDQTMVNEQLQRTPGISQPSQSPASSSSSSSSRAKMATWRNGAASSSSSSSVIYPWTRRYENWRWVTVAGALVTAVWVPYEMAFSQASPFRPPFGGGASSVLDSVLWAVFVADIFVNCNLAIPSRGANGSDEATGAGMYGQQELEEEEEEEGGAPSRKGSMIVDRTEIVRAYVRSRTFWLDLAGVFPFEAVAVATSSLLGLGTGNVAMASLLRLVSLVRLHRMAPLSDRLQNNPRISLIWFTLARNFAVLFGANHLSACVMYFLARLRGFDDHTWLGPVVSEMSGFQRYVVSLYQAVVTFSTVGYGVRACLPSVGADVLCGKLYTSV